MIKKIRNSKGFTLVELILAVAILSILLAFSFVNVAAYMRSMKQLELDGYAKEIFIAAQNHLIMAESNGYYGRSTASAPEYFGTLENDTTSTYYFVSSYTDSTDTGSTNLKNTLLYRMVPPGSIDVGNTNYIIRYDLNTGRVRDVFCTEKEGTSRYGFNNLQRDYSFLVNNLRGDDNKVSRRSYGDNKSVIGYYGGTELDSIVKNDDLKAPEVTIVNGEELTATVKVNEILAGSIEIILQIEGLQSGSISELILYDSGAKEYSNVSYDASKQEWSIELDRIKGSSGRHFADLFQKELEPKNKFYPGENISLQAYLFDTSKVSNIAYGNIEITNSLFGNYTEIDDENKVTASIENLRHLENLSYRVSNVHNGDSPLVVKNAIQVKDINMPDSGFNVIPFGGSAAVKGLMPIYTGSGKKLEYEGNNFWLKKIYIESEADEDAGIFGELESGSKVKNLKIIDPSITGNNNVGALVGESISSELSGVYVYEETTHEKGIISDGETGTAGGLVGKMNGGKITGCFASVLVEAEHGNAGGLVGEADGSTIKASYSGGHTEGGEYPTGIDGSGFNKEANIKAENGNAGGLIGNANNSTEVQSCYSTCSASGIVAGGFVGSDSGAKEISDCYCTGLVNGSTTAGGFSGTGSATSYSNNRYLETVVYDYENPINATGGLNSREGIRPMDPDTGDEDYADFTNYDNDLASDAFPYDTALGRYYHHLNDKNVKYPFKTIMGSPDYKLFTEDLPDVITDPYMMKTHRGDWPMAETIVINIK